MDELTLSGLNKELKDILDKLSDVYITIPIPVSGEGEGGEGGGEVLVDADVVTNGCGMDVKCVMMDENRFVKDFNKNFADDNPVKKIIDHGVDKEFIKDIIRDLYTSLKTFSESYNNMKNNFVMKQIVSSIFAIACIFGTIFGTYKLFGTLLKQAGTENNTMSGKMNYLGKKSLSEITLFLGQLIFAVGYGGGLAYFFIDEASGEKNQSGKREKSFNDILKVINEEIQNKRDILSKDDSEAELMSDELVLGMILRDYGSADKEKIRKIISSFCQKYVRGRMYRNPNVTRYGIIERVNRFFITQKMLTLKSEFNKNRGYTSNSIQLDTVDTILKAIFYTIDNSSIRNKFLTILQSSETSLPTPTEFDSFLSSLSTAFFIIDYKNNDSLHANVINYLKGIINNQLGDIPLDVVLFHNTLQNVIYNMIMCKDTSCSTLPSQITQSSSGVSISGIRSNVHKNIKFLVEQIEMAREYDIFDRDAINSKGVNSKYHDNFVDFSIFNRRVLKMTPSHMKSYFENVKCVSDQFDQFISSTSSTSDLSNQFKKTNKNKTISLIFITVTICGTGLYMASYVSDNQNEGDMMKKAMIASGWLLMSSVLYYYWNMHINNEQFKEILYNYNTRTLRDEMVELSNIAGCTLKEYAKIKQELDGIADPSNNDPTTQGSCSSQDLDGSDVSGGNTQEPGVSFIGCNAQYVPATSLPFLNQRCIIYSLKGQGKAISKDPDENAITTTQYGIIDPIFFNTWIIKDGIDSTFLIELQQCTATTVPEYLGIQETGSGNFDIVITNNPFYWFISEDTTRYPEKISKSYIISSRNAYGTSGTIEHGISLSNSGNVELVTSTNCPTPFFISSENNIIYEDQDSISRHIGFYAKKDTYVPATTTITMSSPNKRFNILINSSSVQTYDSLTKNKFDILDDSEIGFYDKNNRKFTDDVFLTDLGVIKKGSDDIKIFNFSIKNDMIEGKKNIQIAVAGEEDSNNKYLTRSTDNVLNMTTDTDKLCITLVREFPGIYSMNVSTPSNESRQRLYVDIDGKFKINVSEDQPLGTLRSLFSFEEHDTSTNTFMLRSFTGEKGTFLSESETEDTSNNKILFFANENLSSNPINIVLEECGDETVVEGFEEVTQSGVEVSNEIFYKKLLSTIELFDRCNFIRYKKVDVPFPMIEMIVNISMLAVFLLAIIFACKKIIGNGYNQYGGDGDGDGASSIPTGFTKDQKYSRYVIMAVMILTSIIMSYNIFKTTYVYNNQLFQGYNFASRDC